MLPLLAVINENVSWPSAYGIAISRWSGLNTAPRPHVRSNTGSPAMSGGPRNTRPCYRSSVRGIRGAWLPVFPRVQPSRQRRLMERAPCP